MNKAPIYRQVLLNALPVVGYWFWGWSMFAIVYIYWVEALLMSIFVFLKVAMAQGKEPETGRVAPPLGRVFTGLKVLLMRVGLLMFYWVFIFFFVAMGQGKNDDGQTYENLKIVFFMHPGFNLALLAFFLSQIIEFIRNFIMTDAYKNTHFSQHKLFFDARTIIIHIVVVLGTFAYQFLYRYASIDDRLPGLGFVMILFLVKTLADIFIHTQPFKLMAVALEKQQQDQSKTGI